MTIIDAAQKIVSALQAAGYSIANGATSNGQCGVSKYIYASIGNKSVKVRVSDHTISNPVRMASEVTVYPLHNDNFIADSVRSVDLKLRPDLFQSKQKTETSFEEMTIGEREINETTDEIISFDGISKRGGKKYKIRRMVTKTYVSYIYK